MSIIRKVCDFIFLRLASVGFPSTQVSMIAKIAQCGAKQDGYLWFIVEIKEIQGDMESSLGKPFSLAHSGLPKALKLMQITFNYISSYLSGPQRPSFEYFILCV